MSTYRVPSGNLDRIAVDASEYPDLPAIVKRAGGFEYDLTGCDERLEPIERVHILDWGVSRAHNSERRIVAGAYSCERILHLEVIRAAQWLEHDFPIQTSGDDRISDRGWAVELGSKTVCQGVSPTYIMDSTSCDILLSPKERG